MVRWCVPAESLRFDRRRDRGTEGGGDGSSADSFVQVKYVPSCMKLLRELHVPAFMLVEFHPSHAQNIGRQFDITLDQWTHLLRPRYPTKYFQLQNDILTSSRTLRAILQASDIVRSNKYYGKANVTMRFEFLNNGSSLVCLFMENDGFQAKLLQKASNSMLAAAMTVHHKDAPRCCFR